MHAVLFIQFGNVSHDKQIAICLGYLRTAGYELASLVRGRVDQVLAVVRAKQAEVVVVAYGGQAIAAAVAEAGGRVEAVHPEPHVVEPVPVPAPQTRPVPRALLDGLSALGKTVEEVAEFLGVTTGEVRRRRDDT